jgi:NSS family neurotransmitter:Na+ symporter
VAFFDSAVAIISGLIIFSIVFATPGIEASAGPGLMFISLPVAFGSMPGGLLIGAVFFVLVSIAAWSSAISLLEPCVAWLMEAKTISRAKANLVIATLTWLLGLGSVLSFNVWSEYKLAGFTYFDFLDFLTANIMLPISGLLITLFVGYAIKRDIVDAEMQGTSERVLALWQFTIRYVAPFAIALVFIMGVYDKFIS